MALFIILLMEVGRRNLFKWFKKNDHFYSSGAKFKGHRLEGTYVNGVKEGPFVYYYGDGSSRKGTYTNGKREFNN